MATPIGRLTKKIQCQLIAWVITPPSSSPIEAPAAATKLKTPIAFACSAGSGNIVTIMPRITAEAIAPPTPWTNRATISTRLALGRAAQRRRGHEHGEPEQEHVSAPHQVAERARPAAAGRRR